MKPEVIVIGQNSSIILGFCRDLGTGGFDVHIIKTNGVLSYECKSKYAKSCRSLGISEKENFVDFMISNYKSENSKNVIIPADDPGTLLVDSCATKLLPFFYFPNIAGRAGGISLLMNKWYQKQIAIGSGLKTVAGWNLIAKDDNYNIPQDINFPCFVKPAIYVSARKKMMFRCENKEELSSKLRNLESKIPLMVEEFVSIDKEIAVLGLNTTQGLLIAGMVEGNDMLNGVTSVGTARYVSSSSELFVSIKLFLDKIGYYGLFDMDFLESKGNLYFCELNTRLGNSGVAFLKKINLANMLVKSLLGEKIDVNLPKYEDFTFADERVCNAKCIIEKQNKQAYNTMVRKVDVRFIKDKQDILPYLNFTLSQQFVYYKSFLKTFFK